jgi:excisionase family DNA binding protein
MLLTTIEVARVLKVHPKHVYRLIKRGLPAHRVGDEWRFDENEVRQFWGVPVAAAPEAERGAVRATQPLLASNGDLLLDVLFDEAQQRRAPLLGHVQADHATGLEQLRRGAVLLCGCHGADIPASVPDVVLARIHLAQREVGLVYRRGLRVRRASAMVGRRVAGRPATAGVRAHLEAALRREGVELDRAYASVRLHPSHRSVVMAVLREDAEIGLATRAWSIATGLGFLPLAWESYGLVLRAEDLSDVRVAALCEAAQSTACRRRLRSEYGYDSRRSGEIRLKNPASARSEAHDTAVGPPPALDRRHGADAAAAGRDEAMTGRRTATRSSTRRRGYRGD